MVKTFDTIRRGFQLYENIIDELFGYLENCKYFINRVFFKKEICSKYTTEHTKCNTKKNQRCHSESYLANNMLYKNQTIKIRHSCNMWRITKSVISVITIIQIGFGCLHAVSTYFQCWFGVAAGSVF